MSADADILAVFAYFILLFILFALIGIDRKLGRMIRLLERANEQRHERGG